VIPDWLREVPRYTYNGYVLAVAGDGEWVRLADVVAAAQAMVEQAQQAVDFHREMAARFEEGRHDLKQRVRELERRIAKALDLLKQNPDGWTRHTAGAVNVLEGISSSFDAQEAIRNGELPASHSPDLTALRAAVARANEAEKGAIAAVEGGVTAFHDAEYAVFDAARAICEEKP
jgi:predicted phage gp36 major capsid-like protein